MITIEIARSIRVGMIVFHKYLRNADGTPRRFKVTSVHTYKRNPERFRIGLLRGIRKYGSFVEVRDDNYNRFQFVLKESDVLPLPYKSGCCESEQVNHRNDLYVFHPTEKRHSVYNFDTKDFREPVSV